MHHDSRGHAITTDSPDAARAVDSAIAHLIGRRSAVMASIDAAIAADPDCVMAQTLSGLMACGARKNTTLDTARSALIAAQGSAATPRERLYVDALEHAIARRPEAIVTCYESILEQNPTDLLAAVMAQGELFWTGDMARSARLSARIEPAWSDSIEGYADWLALRAFDLEEAGEYDVAERLGRESVERDPHNLWGAHAVSHVLEMRGDSVEGVRWLDGLKDGWDAGGPMKFHLWWHRCLCHVELGEHEQALALHDQWLRNDALPFQQAVPDFYLDVQNAASHLLRLELAGVDVAARWEPLATAIHSSWDDLSNPFTTLHVAMVLAAVGQSDRLDSLVKLVASTQAEGYRDAAPVLQAIRSHRAGQYADVVSMAAPLRGALWRFGGSHAQRDVLFQLVFDAARNVGDQNLMHAIGTDLERIGFQAPFERAAYRLQARADG